MDQRINGSKHLIYNCLSINFRFSGRVSKPTKTSDKNHLFYNIVLLKNLILQKIYSCSTAKKFSRFSRKSLSGWCWIKHLRCTIYTAFSKYLESKCLYFPVDLRKKILLQWRRKFLFGRWKLDNFLKAARCFFL